MHIVIPLSQALRERTGSEKCTGNDCSAGAAFMSDLMTGRGTRDDYVSLVAQNFFIYDALESAAHRLAGDDVASQFITPQLTRLPAIEQDLRFLIGEHWRSVIRPLPTTARYVDRLQNVVATWAGGFIAHHYIRYLGDLSGSGVIRGLVQRQFGFETNGVGFLLFDQIAKPKRFKETYRDQLDAVGWSQEERERVIDEVLVAYRFTTELFEDLSLAKAAA